MIKSISRAAGLLGAITMIISVSCLPKAASSGAVSGLRLCGEVIIPSIFPLTAAAGFIQLLGTGKLLNLIIGRPLGRLLRLPDEAAVCVALSFISGYPVGAITVRRLYDSGIIDRQSANRMLAYSVNAGPAMIVLVCGVGLFGSAAIGGIMYIANLAASLIIGAVLGLFAPKATTKITSRTHSQSVSEAFVQSVSDAATAMLIICGTVVLASTVTELLKQFGLPSGVAALLEVTNGCVIMAPIGIPAVSATLGFAGLSVICQVMTASKGISPLSHLIFCRSCHAGLSYLLCKLLLKLFKITVPTISNGVGATMTPYFFTPAASVAMLFFGAITLFCCSSDKKGFTMRVKL